MIGVFKDGCTMFIHIPIIFFQILTWINDLTALILTVLIFTIGKYFWVHCLMEKHIAHADVIDTLDDNGKLIKRLFHSYLTWKINYFLLLTVVCYSDYQWITKLNLKWGFEKSKLKMTVHFKYASLNSTYYFCGRCIEFASSVWCNG